MLGEELVVYRDRSGHLGIVDKYCTHRRASLAYGVVEEDGIRCQYHGWKFDASGACIEQPFEDTTHPEDNFRDKCGIRAYEAQELGGLVFAYMGPGAGAAAAALGPAGLGELRARHRDREPALQLAAVPGELARLRRTRSTCTATPAATSRSS